MPDALVNPLRRFYARHRGTRSFVDGLRQQLEAAGAKLLTGTVLESCDIHTRRAHWRTPDGCAHEVPFDRLVFATGPMGAARLCGIDPMSYGFERPLEHRIVNIALDAPTRSDLSYFYALDPEDAYFRVTNYRSFSGDADDTRLSIEVLSDPGADVPPVDRILTRLRAIGFLDRQRPIFTAVETLAAGFPLPTTNNMQAMARINADLLAVCPPHVQICGVGSGDGNFFQTEVLVDVYRRLMA
ncbi:MAG: hypothetical protein JHC61_05950 [Burkholderiaceae bacterium]|nr:hypothetical protein [Burkholderiaceae bacterium]